MPLAHGSSALPSVLFTGAMTGKQRAIDLATKVAIINTVETGIKTKSEIARATNCLGVSYLLF